jgi:hypothetical protein
VITTVMPRKIHAAAGPLAPIRVGARPRNLLLAGTVLLALGVACNPGSADQIMPPIDLGMTSNMAAYYTSQNLTMYEAQLPVQLPVKKPTGDRGAAPAGTPYPHAPWLTVQDESLEVHFTISNIDPQDHNVWLLIDPWNEFVRWYPGVTVVNDEETVPNFGYDLAFHVPAMSRVDGTLTTDDMHEIAIKLASTMNLLASPQAQAAANTPPGQTVTFDAAGYANNIFNPQNRSNSGDPLYTPWIPPVIAGLTGFDLGIRTYEAANVAVEITIDLQDLNGNRFVEAGSSDPQLGPPKALLSPPGAR